MQLGIGKQRIEEVGQHPELGIQHLSCACALLGFSRVPMHSRRPPEPADADGGRLECISRSAHVYHAIAGGKAASACHKATGHLSERRDGAFSITGTAAEHAQTTRRVLIGFELTAQKIPPKALLKKTCDSNDGKGLFSIYIMIAIESYLNECEKNEIDHHWMLRSSQENVAFKPIQCRIAYLPPKVLKTENRRICLEH